MPAPADSTTDVQSDPHATETRPTTLSLTAEQSALLGTLDFATEYQLAHLPKTAPDVPTAFGPTVLATIGATPALGGPARVATIQSELDLHQKLTALLHVIAPLHRLVAQNLLQVDAKLAGQLGEVLKVASALKASHPHLNEGLTVAKDWSKSHHPGRGPAKPDPAPTK